MSNRRRRGRRSSNRGPHQEPAPLVAADPGRQRIDADEDKRRAMALDQAVTARRTKRSFVLCNRHKLTLVAVCHCATLEDLVELQAAIDGLQRTYHPQDDAPVRGEPAPLVEAPYVEPPPAAGRVMPPRGAPIAGVPPIEFTHRTRAPRLIARGTPPPDEHLDKGHYGRYEQQPDYEG